MCCCRIICILLTGIVFGVFDLGVTTIETLSWSALDNTGPNKAAGGLALLDPGAICDGMNPFAFAHCMEGLLGVGVEI